MLYQNTVVYDRSKVKDYIYQAGGYKQEARRRPFVVYMNGKVAATRGGFLCKRYPKVEPGCQVIVPMKQERKGNGLANVMGKDDVSKWLPVLKSQINIVQRVTYSQVINQQAG